MLTCPRHTFAPGALALLLAAPMAHAVTGFGGTDTTGGLSVTVGSAFVNPTGSVNAPTPIYARGTPTATTGGNDYKIRMSSTLNNDANGDTIINASDATVTDGATLRYSFYARLANFTGIFTQFMSFQRVGVGKVAFSGAWPYPGDQLWHYYETTFTVNDTAVTDGTINKWDITDFFISQSFADSDGSYIFEIDSISLVDIATSQQIFLAQTSTAGPAYQNANFDNGDPTGQTTLWQPVNIDFKNHTAPFVVAPEPGMLPMLALAGLILRRR